MRVWVLTTEINEYEQLGEYFVAVFKERPTIEQLLSCDVWEESAEYVWVCGGGRITSEYQWWWLREEEVI